MMKPKKVRRIRPRTNITLSAEAKADGKKLAKEDGTTLSGWVERKIREKIAELKAKGKK